MGCPGFQRETVSGFPTSRPGWSRWSSAAAPRGWCWGSSMSLWRSGARFWGAFGDIFMGYPLVMTNIAIKNGHL